MTDYKIGPGRPPREYQFKPGQSGNPKGAKRKPPSLIPDLKKMFQQALNQKVTVSQGERQRVITMLAAGMRQFAIQFAKGDQRARHDFFLFADRLGMDFSAAKKAFHETLAADRQAILDAYLERQTRPKDTAAPSPVIAPPELRDYDAPDQSNNK
jgi:hypothetical protein